MSLQWRLKSFLSSRRGIYKPIELQQRIVKKTGVLISLQNLSNYINKKPSALKPQTLTLICTALECELKDFCEIKPSPSLLKKSDTEVKKLAYENTPFGKRADKSFPDPKDYE